LYKIYPNGFHAVKGVTFGVEHNQILGLLGPNGAGKSSTFNMITGLVPKSNGSIYLENNIPESLVYHDIGVCP